jgi:hypothetical protein
MRSDRRSVGLYSNQTDTYPIVAVSGILEKAEYVRITGLRSTDLSEKIFVAIKIDIGECDAVSFMHLSGSG